MVTDETRKKGNKRRPGGHKTPDDQLQADSPPQNSAISAPSNEQLVNRPRVSPTSIELASMRLARDKEWWRKGIAYIREYAQSHKQFAGIKKWLDAKPTEEDPVFQAAFAKAVASAEQKDKPEEQQILFTRYWLEGKSPKVWLSEHTDPANPNEPYYRVRGKLRQFLRTEPRWFAPVLKSSIELMQQLSNSEKVL